MSNATKRSIVRWIHIVLAIPIIGYKRNHGSRYEFRLGAIMCLASPKQCFREGIRMPGVHLDPYSSKVLADCN